MNSRRLLIIGAAACLAPACASLKDSEDLPGLDAAEVVAPAPLRVTLPLVEHVPSPTERPYVGAVTVSAGATTSTIANESGQARSAQTGRAAIAAANVEARAASRSDQFVGGVQVFAWAPGRVYEVWTAPLRVTTLTLAPGETVQAKAAGDTVRWQIGDTTSGSGTLARTHILLKPLERGLETNLVLTTNHRVYLLSLKSGSAEAFNAAIAWDAPDVGAAVPIESVATAVAVDTSVVRPEGVLDAHYRIHPQGRAPRWTPTAVFNDGVRTFITFAPDVWTDEAPALFVIAAGGEAQLVNYRQQGGLVVVDRLFDEAELRLGAGRPRVVRLQRLPGARP